MIFKNLSIMQNILFWFACLGLILLITYSICALTGYIKSKRNVTSDDIDNISENFEEPRKFIYNAFTIKGSIILLAITFSFAFFLSLFINEWISLVIGFAISLGIVILFAFIDRENRSEKGEIALVSETIPDNDFGKVIILSSGAEMLANSKNTQIKKGKKVIIVETAANFVTVEKFKR